MPVTLLKVTLRARYASHAGAIGDDGAARTIGDADRDRDRRQPGALPSSTLTGVSRLTPVVVLPMLAFSAATTLAVIC